MNPFGHDQPRRSRAALSGRIVRALHGDVDRHLQIRIVEHHERVLAAHFELHFGEPRARVLRNRPSRADRPREADGGDIRMVDDRVSHDGTGARHEIEHARRDAGLVQDLGERPCTSGRPLRGLEHDGVPIGQRGRDLPRGNGNREIPGRDQTDDADRLARDFHVDTRANRGQLFAREAHRLSGKELENLAGARGLADTLCQRLPFFAREQPADLVLSRQDFRSDSVEDIGAPLNRARRPLRKHGLRGGDRRARLLGVGHRVLADHVREIRRIAIGDGVCPTDPFAGDVVVECRRHIPSQRSRRSARFFIKATAPNVQGAILSL